MLLEGINPSAISALAKAGYDSVVCYPKALPTEQLMTEVKDAHIMGIRSRTQLSAEVIEAAPRLVAIGCFCIGTNQVDSETAFCNGIPVFNAPFSNTRSVAELVMAGVVLLLRRVPQRSTAAHRGEWQKTAAGSQECRVKTFGIIGYGKIGMQLGVIADGLGMKVIYFDVESKLPLGNAQPKAILFSLLKDAH